MHLMLPCLIKVLNFFKKKKNLTGPKLYIASFLEMLKLVSQHLRKIKIKQLNYRTCHNTWYLFANRYFSYFAHPWEE